MFFTLLVLCIFPAGSPVGDTLTPSDKTYFDELISTAREKRLWENRFWRLLLHYRPNAIASGFTSEADGRGFFLSPDGKQNPQAEFESTLAAFFSSVKIQPGNMTAQCTFPARLRWLREIMNIDQARVPIQICDRFEKWRADVDPESVSLFFSSYFINNPASMFGHTFLRFNKKGRGEEARLLDYAVNFAATVPADENGLIFALRGLFGGYRGHFSMRPFYQKVMEYSHMENRDMWEYRLRIPPSSLDYMLRHTWELGSTYFHFFFLTENCSYQLLSLLEIGLPDLRLIDQYSTWTLPSDTVKQIVNIPGLVAKKIYWPSQRSLLEQKFSVLNGEEHSLLNLLVKKPETVYSPVFKSSRPVRQGLMIDTGIELLQLQQTQAKASEALEIKARKRELLLARNRLKTDAPPMRFDPRSSPPEAGHDTSQIGVAWGGSKERRGDVDPEIEPFAEIRIQGGFHNLLSSDDGYPPDSQIRFLDLRVRYQSGSKKWRLERFSLVDLLSLSPFTSLVHQPSWKFAIGWERARDIDCETCAPFFLHPGIGFTLKSQLHRREVYFLFLEGRMEFENDLNSGHRAGFAAALGLKLDLADWWRLSLTGSRTRFTEGQRGYQGRGELNMVFDLGRNLEIGLELKMVGEYREGQMGINFSF